MSWATEEFRDIDLGDKRLDRRAVLLAERLSEKPEASIPEACGGAKWQSYRNESVDLVAPYAQFQRQLRWWLVTCLHERLLHSETCR